MTFLLDTNAFSDLMREHAKVDARLASVSSTHRVVICSIVRGEIQYGIECLPQGKRRQELEAKAVKLFLTSSLASQCQKQRATITRGSSGTAKRRGWH